MAKMRVHEFAKQINATSKEVIELLKKNGLGDKTASSSITDEEISVVNRELGLVKKETKEEPKKEEGKATETKEEIKKENNKEMDKEEIKTVEKTVEKQEEKPDEKREEKKHNIVSVSNPQNSQKNRDNRNFSKDGRPQGERNFNRDTKPQGDRPFNRDGRPQGDRPYNRDGKPQGDRPFNRDGRPQGDRSFNRDGRPQGDRPYNRDGRPQGDRPFNRDGKPQGERSFNRDGGYNKDGNRNQADRGTFNKDKDFQPSNNRGQGNRDVRKDSKPDFAITSKPDSRRVDSRQKDNRSKDKNYDEKENTKFTKPGQFIKPKAKEVEKEEEDTIKTLILPDTLTIKELGDMMKVQPSVIVKKLFMQGKIATINQEIDFDTAEEIALEFNCICEHKVKVDVIAELLKEDEENPEDMVSRPPVVCVMGHVDHGKTSLLDAIRSTNVTSRESGGITQHIGAYVTEINGQKITFLDTPGHEAFTAMRMRGAKSTDIAILVVAADDGVMPQTVEAISHAKAAGIDIVVAVNKIDKPNANVERVKQELTEHGLVAEDWGGDTIFVPVSAHTKEGIDTLLEMILLTAEMRELKANPNRKARGLVIEAQLDKGRGPVATILVQKGTLRVGDNVAAGSCYGKIRAMLDDRGNRVKEAGPSMPVEILGLNDVPNAGEIIVSTESDKEARTFAETFIREGRERLLDDTKSKLSLDDLFTQIQAGNIKELGIIVKADVQGSVEAVKQSLLKLSNEEVMVKIIHGGVGNINESDVSLASASNAIIIGFNVKPDNQARIIAEREKVDMRLYKVIYNAIEDVEAAMKGMLDPKYEEQIIGHAEIRQTYKASGVGTIAGSYVTDGKITKGAKVKVTREDEVIFEGNMASLKRYKDDVKEVKEGYECGIVLEKFNDVKEGDIIEASIMVEIPR